VRKTLLTVLLPIFLVFSNAFAETIFTDISNSIAGREVIAIGDVNRDGKLDLLHHNGLSLNSGNSPEGLPNFELKTDGLDFIGDNLSHVVFVDIDGDGDPDLLAATNSGARLYRNDSCGTDLRFVDITSDVGLGGGFSNEQTHIALADIDNDGDLDFYIAEGWPSGNKGILYRNDTTAVGIHFTDITSASGVIAPRGCRTILFNDFDKDGDADLYLGSDLGTAKFYLNRGDTDGDRVTNFVDVSSASGLQHFAYDNGGTSGDIDNDGDIDIIQAASPGYVATPILVYLNSGDINGDGIVDFKNATNVSGLSITSGHGVGLGDVDNDGDLDLADASFHFAPLRFYSNDGDGTFTDITNQSGIGYLTYGVRTLFADIDNDGDLDLWMNKLFLNNTNNANYLKVHIVGEGLNRDAVGAKLRVWPSGKIHDAANMVAYREITAGTGFFSSDDYILELGLAQGSYELEATFVKGAVVSLDNIDTGQTVNVLESKSVYIPKPGSCGGIPANQPPIAIAGSDQILSCSSPEWTAVILDGSRSSDPDGDTLTYLWTGLFGKVSEVTPAITMPLGTHTITLTVDDGKGLTSDDTVVITVADNKSPVTRIASIEGTAGNNGWYKSSVVVNLDSTDNCSGVKEIRYSIDGGTETVVAGSSASVSISAEGPHTVTYYAKDNAGNAEDTNSLPINIDKTVPSILGTAIPFSNAYGWNNTDVTVTFTCADLPVGIASGIADCSAPVLMTNEGAGQTVTGMTADTAGNGASTSLTVNIDKRPPTITAQLSSTPNAAGWNDSDVTVSFACSDTGSGIAACPPPVTITSEGAGQVVSGTAVDKAGNSATTSVTVNIDKSMPEVTISVNQGDLWPPNHKIVNVAVNGGASDSASGIASIVFTVKDEYGYIEPLLTGFNTTIPLEAWREGTDLDGRHYWITAEITDKAGNKTTTTTEAVVPHDMRK